MRPGASVPSVAAVWPSRVGVRVCTGKIPFATRSVLVWLAITAIAVMPSLPPASPTQAVSYPRSSISFARFTYSSGGNAWKNGIATPRRGFIAARV